MCRFVIYKGKIEILIADLLTRPKHSIIHQSLNSKLRKEGSLNGDGFGLGFYEPDSPTDSPGIFTSILPAWNNLNLLRLSQVLSSKLVFAHVRAATPGLATSESNCHPFSFGPFMFMHNGCIGGFPRIKRRLQAVLRNSLFEALQGTTDSENVFMLFLNQFEDPASVTAPVDPSVLRRHVETTIRLINQWCIEEGVQEESLMNFAITDGQSVLCTRFINRAGLDPVSLYFSSGSSFEREGDGGNYKMVKRNRTDQVVIVASEPLTYETGDWLPVPANHMVVITKKVGVLVYPVNVTNLLPDRPGVANSRTERNHVATAMDMLTV